MIKNVLNVSISSAIAGRSPGRGSVPFDGLIRVKSSMKKVMVVGSTLCAIGLSSAARAQSSVTLYGVLDESLQYTHNVAGQPSQVALYGGQLVTDRFGLFGKEDLGNGLSAIFKLENHFNINKGTSVRMWSQSYVGLSSGTYGTLTFGRQLDPLLDIVNRVQGNGVLEYFTSPGDVDNGDGSVVTNNAVKWASPTWGGLRTEVMYSLGGVAGSVASGQTYSAAVNYKSEPFEFAAGYFHIDNGNPSVSTRGTSSEDSIFNSPVNSAYSSAKSIDIVRTGGTYTAGNLMFGADYSFSQYAADANSSFKKNEYYNSGALFTVWNVTTATKLEAGYVYLKSHGDSSAAYNQVAVAGDYLLSKQTDLYAIVAYGHAAGNNGAGKARAVIADTFQAAGSGSQQVAILGIRHRF